MDIAFVDGSKGGKKFWIGPLIRGTQIVVERVGG